MTEVVGGVGIIPYRVDCGGINPNTSTNNKDYNLFDILEDNYKKRQIIKQELHMKELEKKKAAGVITPSEERELICYKTISVIEKFANILTPRTTCEIVS